MKLTSDVKQWIQRSHWEVNTIEPRKTIARKQRKTSQVFTPRMSLQFSYTRWICICYFDRNEGYHDQPCIMLGMFVELPSHILSIKTFENVWSEIYVFTFVYFELLCRIKIMKIIQTQESEYFFTPQKAHIVHCL